MTPQRASSTGICPDCGAAKSSRHEHGCRRATHNYRKRIRPWKREAVYRRDGYRCVTCGAGDELSIDHIVAIKDGGTNRLENLQTMCRSCNTEKGA